MALGLWYGNSLSYFSFALSSSFQLVYYHALAGIETGELSHEDVNHGFMPEMEDEPALYDEMGKRLNQMVPVPVSSVDFS